MDKLQLSYLFEKQNLLPAIVQEAGSGEVLMLAYMNEVSLAKTIETGYTWFYSRSRQRLWQKGEESGHVQRVVSITGDCDDDTLLVKVEQTGPACHTGAHTCFFAPPIYEKKGDGIIMYDDDLLKELQEIVEQRKVEHEDGSYTAYLLDSGIDKILKKLGEEASETIIAAKNLDAHSDDPEEKAKNLEALYGEVGDLLYHLVVMLNALDVGIEEIEKLLHLRMQKTGNLKEGFSGGGKL